MAEMAQDMVRLSKSMSYLLRHGSEKAGLRVEPDGFVRLSEMLVLPQLRRWSVEDVRVVVETNSKQRFALKTDGDTGELWIRANQGHTVRSVQDDALLTEITDPAELPTVVHGTYLAALPAIQVAGLSRMGRNHIHFAVGMPEGAGVISGMRASAEVVIQLDVAATMAAGIKLYRSANNVVLSPGNASGHIPPEYFSAIEQRRPATGGGGRGGRARGSGTGQLMAVDGGGARQGGMGSQQQQLLEYHQYLGERAAFVRGKVAAGRTLAGPQLAAFVKQLGAGLGSCAPVSQRESARSALATIGWDAAGNAPLAGSRLPAVAAVIACIEWLSAEVGPELQQQRQQEELLQQPQQQPYDFYAVLDFEATCEEGARIRPQEIIEFPTVLLDGATLEAIAEFQQYVRPAHRPVLSKFCTGLTGIQQATVDAARPFSEVLADHTTWLGRFTHPTDGPVRSVCFVTCGDWDLKSMLPAQLGLGGARRAATPRHLRRWINIKTVYQQAVPRGRASGMAGMLRGLGLRLDGRHHSGIDDCRNIAKILRRLGEDGARLECTWPGGGVGAAGRRRGGGGAAAGAGGADAVQAVSATNFRRLQGR